MRYQVMAGDSPAGIARKLTGNAGRMGDLLAANPSKQVALSHGMPTFASLHVGETLNVPRSWRQFGLGQGLGDVNGYSIGATGATAVQPAFAALQGLDFTQPSSCGPVKAAQQAWNAWGTPALTVDGGYGPDTASAWSEVDLMTGGSGQVPAGLTSGWPSCGGGGGGTYSGAVMATATALDAQLAAQGCCGCGQAGSALSNAVAAFKQAILVNPGDWGANSSASTVTGSTINVSDPACQIAFGSELGGTLSDLKAVLGASMTYTGSYCATSNCSCVDSGSNCGQQPPPQPPACTAPQVPDSVTNQCVNPCPGGNAPANGVCPPAPQPSGGGSSNGGAIVAMVLLVGGGAVATGYAIKARRRKVA